MILFIVESLTKDAILDARSLTQVHRVECPLMVSRAALPFIGDNMIPVTRPTLVVTNSEYSKLLHTWFVITTTEPITCWGFQLLNIAQWYQRV